MQLLDQFRLLLDQTRLGLGLGLDLGRVIRLRLVERWFAFGILVLVRLRGIRGCPRLNPCQQQRLVSIRIRIVSDATEFEVVVTWG